MKVSKYLKLNSNVSLLDSRCGSFRFIHPVTNNFFENISLKKEIEVSFYAEPEKKQEVPLR